MAYSGNLRSKNLKAAKAVVEALRANGKRFMNQQEYQEVIRESKDLPAWYKLPQNFDPITVYLTKNGLVTFTSINGFNLYAITPKAYRSKMENLFESPVVIQRGQVNTAIVLCKEMYKYMDPDKFAEYITDRRILPFKGETRDKFIKLFKYWAGETDCAGDTFEVVLGKMKNVTIVKSL